MPEGLSERLLAHLTSQLAASGIEQGPPAAPSAALSLDRASRRQWLRWSVGMATAASIAGVASGLYFLNERQKLTAEKITR